MTDSGSGDRGRRPRALPPSVAPSDLIREDCQSSAVTTTAPFPEDGDSGIRRAERADLLAIYRIEKASFPQPWPYEAFDRFL